MAVLPSVREITTTYDRRGNVARRETRTVGEHATLREAFEARYAWGGVRFPSRDVSIDREVMDERGVRVFLLELYTRENGQEAVDAQMEHPTFSINLDAWLVDGPAAIAAAYAQTTPISADLPF